jgi:hypothetical protein
MDKEQTRIYVQTIALLTRFAERISKLPLNLQEDFLADLETAMENRLKVLERAKNEARNHRS